MAADSGMPSMRAPRRWRSPSRPVCPRGSCDAPLLPVDVPVGEVEGNGPDQQPEGRRVEAPHLVGLVHEFSKATEEIKTPAPSAMMVAIARLEAPA
jgi:hypothetical protein